jgi:DNA-binding XRE family transcriptional regulator
VLSVRDSSFKDAASVALGFMGRTGRRHPAQAELGRRVRAERHRLGISQIALAEIVGLHFSFVSEVERGERNLSLSSLLRLALEQAFVRTGWPVLLV